MGKYNYQFNDYIDYYKNIAKHDWITLFQDNELKNYENDIFTFCALLDVKNLSQEYLDKFDWGFATDSFGKSTFGEYYSQNSKELFFADGESYDEFQYLIALRYFDKYDRSIEINPKLVWYYNLVKSKDGYVHPKTDEIIIKVTKNEIQIRKDYLRDFLCAYQKVCVVVFDHRRFFNKDDNTEFRNCNYNGEHYYLNLNISSARAFNENYDSYSCIIGKAIINPYRNPRHEDYKYFAEDKEFEKFIVDYDEEDDEVIEFTCNEKELANYFGANPNAPHFLTPIYFTLKVLDKYNNDPRNYTITDSQITYLSEWSLPFSKNSDNAVVVWLGDLGRIPYEEQKYWKAFNIKKKGDIEKKFFDRQINNKWTTASRIESRLVPGINRLNSIVNEKYGGVIFNVLSEADNEIYNTFMIPTNLSIPEYQSFLMKLSKLTAESINVKLIKRVMGDDFPTKLGSVLLLGEFLEYVKIDINKAICASIKKAYDSRNKLAGHKGSFGSYNKVWGRDPLYEFNSIADATALLEDIIGSIEYALKELK